ncbi:MAG: hypothetical protein ACOY3U_07990 [Bacillota bacterium]
MRANSDIRRAMGAAGIKQWQLAERLQMHEGSLCRLLRKELPEDKREEILSKIREIEQEQEAVGQ